LTCFTREINVMQLLYVWVYIVTIYIHDSLICKERVTCQ